MCCRDAMALLLDTRSLGVRQVPFDLGVAGLGLLVVDTRVKHELGASAYSAPVGGVPAGGADLGARVLRGRARGRGGQRHHRLGRGVGRRSAKACPPRADRAGQSAPCSWT